MDVELTKKDGTSYQLDDYGIKVKDVIVQSIEIDDTYIEKDNMNGRFLTGSKYVKRKIIVLAFYKVNKLSDIPRVRDLLYELIVDKDPIFLREIRRKTNGNYKFIEPISDDFQKIDDNGFPIYDNPKFNHNNFVNNKRYKVKFNGVINPVQKNKTVNFEIEFETVEIPFSESIGTSLNLEKRNSLKNWASDFDIPWCEDDPKRKYTFHDINSGNVFYHGNASNDQFNQYKKITIVIGEETNRFVWNLTHSEQMVISDVKMKPGDIIIYDGFRVFKNKIEISTKTNISQPKFEYGNNHFEINQVVEKIIFDIKFYFK
ncbi:phage tail domain-containing protein [Staphylococcus xylosus]